MTLSRIVVFIFILLSANLLGCTGPLKQSNISANEFYRAVRPEDLRGNIIGFLTTVVPKGNSQGEYRSLISDIIEKNFKEGQPDIGIIPSREALNRINGAELTKEYAGMLEDYEITGILDKHVLAKIGNILNVKYIAQPRLSSFVERTSTRLSAFGLSLVSTRETTVKVSLQLWDTGTGNIVWEGSGQATIAVEALRAKPVSFEEVAEAASRGLMKKFIMPSEGQTGGL